MPFTRFLSLIAVGRKLVPMVMLLLLSGCSTLGYYAQSIHGHFGLMDDSRSIDELLQDEKIDENLKRKLQLVVEIRSFASEQLGLPKNDSYLSYASLDRKAVVWSVVATKEFSISPKQWCYPVVGCASYRGYFNQQKAQSYADGLSRDGLDVTVDPIPAYSTLGWFDDPLPSTVINWPESRLVGLIFHELAHQQLYVAGDSAFNEGFASAVEQVGVERWFRSRKDAEGLKQWQRHKQRKEGFYRLLLKARNRLQQLYGRPLSKSEMRSQKVVEFERLRSKYRQQKKQWHGYSGFDLWFKSDLNNARLASVATYARWVPAFVNLLEESDGELDKFYQACEKLTKLPKDQRRFRLQGLLK